MKKHLPLAAALVLFTGSAALAQSAGGQADSDHMQSSGSMADKASGSMAPKAKRHRMGKAAMNSSEVETTRQLNEEQARMASEGSSSSMQTGGMQSNSMTGSNMRGDGPTNGMGKVTGANSGVEGRIGGSNSDGPSP